MTRLAVFSDIHGNVVGLDACLADLHRQGGADAIVGAGDFCSDGPKPRQVLQRLAELNAKCVRGNSDRYVISDDLGDFNAQERAQIEWQRREIGDKWLRWMRELPFSLRFGEPGNELLVVHANPTSDDEHIWPDSPDCELERLIGSESANTIAFGHLHLPFARFWRGKLLVNVASAGLPKDGDPRAGYAILTERSGGWEVKHRRVDFNVKKVATQLRSCGIPHSDECINVLRRHRYKKLNTIIP